VKKNIRNSLRGQMIISILATFFILVVSTTYILFSARNLQTILDQSFERERFIKSIQEDLRDYQVPLLEYLSTMSSNALSQILIDSQVLRSKIPSREIIPANKTELRERELYSLIISYLDLADRVIEEKRARDISAYIQLYDEMSLLLSYINSEIDIISTGRFLNQLELFEVFIGASGNVQLWNLLFIIFISIFTVLLLLWSMEKITKPLIKISSVAGEISAGNFSIQDIESSPIHEIDHLVTAFNQMKNEIRRYIEEIHWQENIKQEYMHERIRNMNMEGLIRRMEVYSLQAQMNPHFLFNTLNTGVQLAIVEGAERTGEYIEHLAQMFRHVLRNKDVIVFLRHEIEGLHFYFYILQIRFGKRLDLVLDYEEEMLDQYKVPVSILQPLVENCIVHAFKNMTGALSIIVRVEKIDERIVLSVTDNGCGMQREIADKLLNPQTIDESALSRVTGLENVIQRLYFFYPDDPDIIKIETVDSADINPGARITISIDTRREACIEF
jgi:sensor histidine kinase YesM